MDRERQRKILPRDVNRLLTIRADACLLISGGSGWAAHLARGLAWGYCER